MNGFLDCWMFGVPVIQESIYPTIKQLKSKRSKGADAEHAKRLVRDGVQESFGAAIP